MQEEGVNWIPSIIAKSCPLTAFKTVIVVWQIVTQVRHAPGTGIISNRGTFVQQTVRPADGHDFTGDVAVLSRIGDETSGHPFRKYRRILPRVA